MSNIHHLKMKDNSQCMADSKDWLKFRSIMFDLYSVLDYTYFLLYCHFSEKGQPDHSDKNALKCGFPFKAKGVKTSLSSHDQKQKFIEEKLNFLFGKKLEKKTHFWELIGKAILEVQPTMSVDSAGKEITDGPVISTDVQESFAILHYFRNCCTHRSLIEFHSEDVYMETDLKTRHHKIMMKQPPEKRGFYSRKITKGYWVKLPKHVIRQAVQPDDEYRMLSEVLQQLVEFVKKIKDELLYYALLIPQPEEIDAPKNLFQFEVALKGDDYSQLKQDFIKQIGLAKLKVFENNENHVYSFQVADSLHLSSKYERNDKKAAIENVMKECIRLKIIKLTDN